MEFVGHRFFIFTGCGLAVAAAAHAENPFFSASYLGFPVFNKDPAMYQSTAVSGGFPFRSWSTLKRIMAAPPRKKRRQSRAPAWDVVGFARDRPIATTPMRASCHPERSMAAGATDSSGASRKRWK